MVTIKIYFNDLPERFGRKRHMHLKTSEKPILKKTFKN
jgi:hypothetical protein